MSRSLDQMLYDAAAVRAQTADGDDPINHPKHYTWHPSGVEAATIVEHFPYNIGVAMAYLWRCDHKGSPVEDMKKAIAHIQREIARREGK